jgi:hypothetical protein
MLSKQHIQILIDQTSQDIAGFLSKDATIEWTIWAERDDWTFVIQITNNLNILSWQKSSNDIEWICDELKKDIKKQMLNNNKLSA